MGPAISIPRVVHLHDFAYDASRTRAKHRQLFFGEGISYDDKSVSIEDSFSVFDAVGVNNFETRNAVVAL
jgi:hypothetical protein